MVISGEVNVLSDQAQNRRAQHKLAKNLLYAGKYEAAVELLLATREEYGDHIGLLADVATCYYLRGRIIEWKAYLDQVSDTYESVQTFLSRETRLDVCLLLGKFREEEGKISVALELYDNLLAELKPEYEGELYAAVLAQIARLAVQFELKRPIAEYYNTLHRLVRVEESTDDRVDILHALMLAELEVAGPQAAIERLRFILDLDNLATAERTLPYFDLLEVFLRRTPNSVPEAMAQLGVCLRPQDLYEQMLGKMAFQRDQVSSIVSLQTGLSTANSLRLQSLLFFFEPSLERKIELRRKLVFILNGLDKESAKIWRHYLRHTLQDQNVHFQLCTASGTLRVGDCALSLQRKRNMHRLLEVMIDTEELELEQVVRTVWETDFNESYYHRLRMLAGRLNELLYTNFGVERAIQVDSGLVRVNQAVRISRSDSPA